ncbi:MAG: T9SS type A sorting domain-containing protein, partial [Ignavibacteriota bacterium]
ADKTTIRDTFKLATGCYRFRIFDESSLPEGLYPWLLQINDPKVTFGNFSLKDDKKATIWSATTSNNLASFGPKEIIPFMVQGTASVQISEKTPSLQDFLVYPNPSHGMISLDLTKLGEFSGDLRVAVVSILGKEVIVRTIRYPEASHLELDMQQYPKGSYIVKLQYGDLKISRICVLE